jgi:hypothetical protein
MNTGNYATAIEGVHFKKRREIPPVATSWDYQIAPEFTRAAARRLFEELPSDCEIVCFDPEEPTEERYVFFRRQRGRFEIRKGGHGWLSDWKEELLDRIVDLFSASPFVAKPHPDFESFTVTQDR